MTNRLDAYRFPVLQYGSAAFRHLEEGAGGRGVALFNSTFYVETELGLACIGNEDLYASPLNVVTAAPSTMNWYASGLKRNDLVKVSLGMIRVGNRITFPVNNAEVWQPEPPPQDINVADLKQGLCSFRRAVQGCLPAEGLGHFIQHDSDIMEAGALSDDPVYRAAREPIANLQIWLINVLRHTHSPAELALDEIKTLLGLGPGLTPSGDDFIGGVMVGLHDLGAAETALLCWKTLEQYAAQTGNPISYAHIKAASMGERSDGVHKASRAILKGCPVSMRASLPGIDEIGHTSGWDCMAGIVFAMGCWLTVETDRLTNLRNDGRKLCFRRHAPIVAWSQPLITLPPELA